MTDYQSVVLQGSLDLMCYKFITNLMEMKAVCVRVCVCVFMCVCMCLKTAHDLETFLKH